MEEWSLTKELCSIAGTSKLEDAAYALSLIPSLQTPFTVRGTEWVQGGGETYIYRFDVEIEGQNPIAAILKACVAFSPGRPVDTLLENWIERRKLLSENGVRTPVLYGWKGGVLMEEFIPFSLTEILLRCSKSPDLQLIYQLCDLAALLNRLRFSPVGIFDDLRSHGKDVVAVDFGEDLGPPGVRAIMDDRLFAEFCSFLSRNEIQLASSMIVELRERFFAQETPPQP